MLVVASEECPAASFTSTTLRSNSRGSLRDPQPPSAAPQSPIRTPHFGTVRYPRLVPKDEECAKELRKRTLTNLYNARPAWLDHAHKKLDDAVFAAYGWPVTLTDDDLLAKLLELNLARAGKTADA